MQIKTHHNSRPFRFSAIYNERPDLYAGSWFVRIVWMDTGKMETGSYAEWSKYL